MSIVSLCVGVLQRKSCAILYQKVFVISLLEAAHKTFNGGCCLLIFNPLNAFELLNNSCNNITDTHTHKLGYLALNHITTNNYALRPFNRQITRCEFDYKHSSGKYEIVEQNNI